MEISQLQTLADETRAALSNKLSKAGGHQESNLGVVKLTVVFHYVFDLTEQYDDNYDAGYVINQQWAEGSTLYPGDTIDITVSRRNNQE